MQTKVQRKWLEDLVLLPPERRIKPISQFLEDDLFISAPSKQAMPGGLYHLRKSTWLSSAEIVTVDTLETSGLWLQSNLFIRSLQSMSTMFLVAYSETGQVWTITNSELKNIHDLLIFEDQLYVVSCGTNEVACISMEGEIKERWRFGKGGHTWHINCLSVWDNRLVATCFGRIDKEQPWNEPEDLKPGQVFDVKTGEILWEELKCPHTPCEDPQKKKFVCDSKSQKVLIKEANGEIRELKFPGTFPKALAWGKDKLYVGLAKFRGTLKGVKGIDSGQLAIVDQKTLTVLDYIELPCSEMYNIVVVPQDKNGFLSR